MNVIKVKSRCIICRGNEILALRQKDEKGEYYFLIGGSVEFGETSREALVREVREEFQADIIIDDLITIYEQVEKEENAHAILFFYKASFVKKDLYKKSVFKANDGRSSIGVWIKIEDIQNNTIEVRPKGLAQFIKR